MLSTINSFSVNVAYHEIPFADGSLIILATANDDIVLSSCIVVLFLTQ